MNEGLIVVVVLLVFLLVTVAKGVRLVAQGEEWVVERLGKYHSTLRPGLNILIPYLDRVAYKLGHQGHHPRCSRAGSDHPRQRGNPHQCHRLR